MAGKFKFTIPTSVAEITAKSANMWMSAARYFKNVLTPPFEIVELIRQLYEIGYKSFALIGVTGFIIGLTLTLQTIPTMQKFGAESMVPSMVAIALLREISPVITALIFAGKIGSGIGAELGSMKVTEQIDAMEVSGTNPFEFLVVTRITATTLMLPVLVLYSDALGLFGSFVAINIAGSSSMTLFLINAFSNLTFIDIIPATIKTFFFGFAVGLTGCFEGYNVSKGTESVGIAANTAVVVSSLLVIMIDMITVQLTTIFELLI